MSRFTAFDLAFDGDGDLVVAPNGDVAVARDGDVLARDILDRLACLPGELPAHPTWGCRIKSLLGAPDSPKSRMLAQRFLREALEDDPRVEDSSISIQPVAAAPEEKVYRIRFAEVGSDTLQEWVWGFGLSGAFTISQGEIQA